MAYWADEDDVIGDRSADLMHDQLVDYLGEHTKPRYSDLLRGLVDASDFALDRACEAIEVVGADGTLVARFAVGATVERALTRIFARWSLAVDDEYRQSFDRGPRTSEALKTLEFVVRRDPARYLEDPQYFEIHAARLVRKDPS